MTDEYFMREALKEAQKAFDQDEVPVGCVIVKNDEIIARAHNLRQKTHDVFGHAETRAIIEATKKVGAWILDDATIYVTIEPCMMCMGSIIQARIKRLVYGSQEPKNGCVVSKCDIKSLEHTHIPSITGNILKEEASNIMKLYFKQKR
jgi:tRNA(adenine34) deaminase